MTAIHQVARLNARPSAVLLQDRVPAWLRVPRTAAGFALLIGILHCYYSFQRLHHTDLWGHLAYGRLIFTAHALPATEPMMPLSRGMPFIDTAWLTQLVGYQIFLLYGPAGIQFLHAAAISVCLSLLTWGCFSRTRSFGFTALGLAMFEILNWYQFQIVRPQMAGLVGFCVLVTCLTARRWRPWARQGALDVAEFAGIQAGRAGPNSGEAGYAAVRRECLPHSRPAYWLAVSATFVIWANMHGSFIVGQALLVCATAGRVVNVWRRTGRWSAIRHDAPARRLFLTTGLAIVAALLNPYGLRLYSEVLSFSSNPNLESLIEWQPLNFRTMQGKLAATAALALVVVSCWSPRRMPAGEILAVVAFAAPALWSARFLVWWTPLVAASFAMNAHAAWRRFHPSHGTAAQGVRTGKWTAIALGLAAIFLASTPLGIYMLSGKSAEIAKSVGKDTPVAAVLWLQQHPPAGQIFNSYEWGDYLAWAGPPSLKVFVTSHAHLVPHEVWRDYLTVINLGSNWDDVFDRYAIDTIVVDQADRGDLISKLKTDLRWNLSYEDGLAAIFTRPGVGKIVKKQAP